MEPWDWQLAVSQSCRGRPGLSCQLGCAQHMVALKPQRRLGHEEGGKPAEQQPGGQWRGPFWMGEGAARSWRCDTTGLTIDLLTGDRLSDLEERLGF